MPFSVAQSSRPSDKKSTIQRSLPMPKVGFDPATKEAILKAALDARNAGQAWNLAHAAAKQAGYKVSAVTQNRPPPVTSK
jgi:hypothetical protein